MISIDCAFALINSLNKYVEVLQEFIKCLISSYSPGCLIRLINNLTQIIKDTLGSNWGQLIATMFNAIIYDPNPYEDAFTKIVYIVVKELINKDNFDIFKPIFIKFISNIRDK